MAKKTNPKDNGVHLPFLDDAFVNKWQEWLEYRKEQRFPSYKPRGLKATFEELIKISGNNSEVACVIIQRSLSNTWRGLFPLPKNYGHAAISQPITADKLRDALASRLEGKI